MAKFKIASLVGSCLLSAPLLLAATSVEARQNVQAEAAAQGNTAASNDGFKASGKEICRQLDATGTRMTRRACHTADEWKRIEQMR